jgi:hypothetical protein
MVAVPEMLTAGTAASSVIVMLVLAVQLFKVAITV